MTATLAKESNINYGKNLVDNYDTLGRIALLEDDLSLSLTILSEEIGYEFFSGEDQTTYNHFGQIALGRVFDKN